MGFTAQAGPVLGDNLKKKGLKMTTTEMQEKVIAHLQHLVNLAVADEVTQSILNEAIARQIELLTMQAKYESWQEGFKKAEDCAMRAIRGEN